MFCEMDWPANDVPTYSEALLSPEAKRNVATLKAIAEAGAACTKEPAAPQLPKPG